MSNLNNYVGSLKIDNKDAWQDYGFVVLKGSMRDWLSFAEMKPPFSHDWGDEHGRELALENVFVKDKEVSLKVLFIADSQLQFWANYNKTRDMLQSSGIRKIYYRELEKEFEVYYTKTSQIATPTRLKGGKIMVEMTLNFNMPDPLKVDEKLVLPTSISLSTPSIIQGSASFSYTVLPATASQGVRSYIIAGSGNGNVSGNMIYATRYGTASLRVESLVDKNVFAQRNITMFPENIIAFANGEMLSSGSDYITIN